MTPHLSCNPDFGFRGTIANSGYDGDEAFALAAGILMASLNAPQAAVVSFLDSTHGRHLADEVADRAEKERTIGDAIVAVVARRRRHLLALL